MSGFTYEASAEPPESVRPDLLRLWSENLKLEQPADEKFRWLYRSGPHPAPTVHLLRAREAEGASRVVGTSGVGIRHFQLGGHQGRAGVVGDLAVDQEHRGLLPALLLLRSVREALHTGFDVAYGFPNTKAEGAMVRAGFRRLGKARRFVRVLRHAGYAERIGERFPDVPPALARLLRAPALARVAGGALDVARLGAGAVDVARAAATFRLVWTSRIDERFDQLWRAARAEYVVVGERTAPFLRWRYPVCDVATLLRRADGKLRAYAVVELDRSTGAARVHDVFGHQADLAALFDLLLPALYLRGAASVSVRFLGAPHVSEVLTARGFEARDEGRTVVVDVGGTESAQRAVLEDPAAWHLFDEDEDV